MIRSSSRKRTSCRLNVEALEERSLMACNLFASAGILYILGDAGNDHIAIHDDGNGTVTGSATGAGNFSMSGITGIVIDSGNGNDHVTYDLANGLQSGITRTVEVNLRGGNDQFTATLHGAGQPSTFQPDALLLMKVVGENGNDKIALDAGGVTMDHATMKIAFYGGAGNDQISMNYSGLNDHGGVSFFAFGNEGNDSIWMSMAADPASVAPAPGGFRGIIEAGDGNDDVYFHVFALNDVSSYQTSLDGGNGTDHATTDIDPDHVSGVESVDLP